MKTSERRCFEQTLGALVEGASAEAVPRRREDSAERARQEARSWLRYRGIQGIAIGTRKTDGVDTGEPCITLYVTRKQPRKRLNDPAPGSVRSLALQDGALALGRPDTLERWDLGLGVRPLARREDRIPGSVPTRA